MSGAARSENPLIFNQFDKKAENVYYDWRNSNPRDVDSAKNKLF